MYKFTSKKRPESWSIQDQKGYDAIKAKGWLGRFNIQPLNDGPEVPIEKKTFLPPELQKLRPIAAEPVVQEHPIPGPDAPTATDKANG